MTNEELMKNHSEELIKKILAGVRAVKQVDVRFEFEDEDQWSQVSIHNYDEDKEYSLRLQGGDNFQLCLGYYDENDEFFEIFQPLLEDEKKLIPSGLKKIMMKVLADEEGMRVPGSLVFK